MQRVAQIVRRCEQDLLNQAQPTSFNPTRRSSVISISSAPHAPPLPEPTPIVEPDAPSFIPEPTIDWGSWNYPSYNPFGLGIDWEAAFPSEPEMQYTGSDETAASFLVPMRT